MDSLADCAVFSNNLSSLIRFCLFSEEGHSGSVLPIRLKEQLCGQNEDMERWMQTFPSFSFLNLIIENYKTQSIISLDWSLNLSS